MHLPVDSTGPNPHCRNHHYLIRGACFFCSFEVYRTAIAPNDLLDQLGGTPQSLLQAHLAYAWSDAFSRLRGLSFGLCCQGENRSDVCKTTSIFSGMENQVKRQIRYSSLLPLRLGVPQAGGEGGRSILHTFSDITYMSYSSSVISVSGSTIFTSS